MDQGVELPIPYPTQTPLADMKEIHKEVDALMARIRSTPLDTDSMIPKIEPQLLSDCQNSETKVEDLQDAKLPGGLAGENSPLEDLLFMKASDISTNYAELYGKVTSVIPYDAGMANVSWILTRDFEVPCLPYRIRIQNNKTFRDEGVNALKNYDTSSKGTLIRDSNRKDGAFHE